MKTLFNIFLNICIVVVTHNTSAYTYNMDDTLLKREEILNAHTSKEPDLLRSIVQPAEKITIRDIEKTQDTDIALELVRLYCDKKIANIKSDAWVRGNGTNINTIELLAKTVDHLITHKDFGEFFPYTIELQNKKIVLRNPTVEVYFDSTGTMKNFLCCMHALEAIESK